jgi:hypothetical protein
MADGTYDTIAAVYGAHVEAPSAPVEALPGRGCPRAGERAGMLVLARFACVRHR